MKSLIGKYREEAGVISTCYRRIDDVRSFTAEDHALVYVARGGMTVLSDGQTLARVKEGECVFVRRDHRVTLSTHPSREAGYHVSVVLKFPRRFLFSFYKTLSPSALPENVRRDRRGVLKINKSAPLESLFESFKPYWLAGEEPDREWLRMKVSEGLRIVLAADSNTYASLFDFATRWRRDILEFMEENYMYDLSLEQLARYTGRSLATFKRDFAAVSSLSPRRWLIARRLDAARHRIINTTDHIGVIMADVGFKNFSHFSKIYREKYGMAPSAEKRPVN